MGFAPAREYVSPYCCPTLVVDGVDFFGDAGAGVGIFPGFVEFCAAFFFFGGDSEDFADALADFFPVGGDWTVLVGARVC